MNPTDNFCVIKRQVKPQNNAARERSRVKTLRSAFLDLQRSLPAVPPNTKLSKLDILVLATAYIFHLTRTLEDQDLQEASMSTSQEHHRSSRHTAQGVTLQATEAHTQQQASVSAAASSSKAYASLATEEISKHKRLNCYEQLAPSCKCPVLGYNSSRRQSSSRSLHFSQATHAHTDTSVAGKQGSHPLKGTVGILHPVKKWPMRSRLYDSILACTAKTGIIQSSKSATSASFSIAR